MIVKYEVDVVCIHTKYGYVSTATVVDVVEAILM